MQGIKRFLPNVNWGGRKVFLFIAVINQRD